MINLQKFVHSCNHELPTNMQNFMQKDLTTVRRFFGEATFFLKYPVYVAVKDARGSVRVRTSPHRSVRVRSTD